MQCGDNMTLQDSDCPENGVDTDYNLHVHDMVTATNRDKAHVQCMD
jgi:hypothetical protein